MKTIANNPGEYSYVIGPYRDPVNTVSPGETFAIETLDAFENKIDSSDADITKTNPGPLREPADRPHTRGRSQERRHARRDHRVY